MAAHQARLCDGPQADLPPGHGGPGPGFGQNRPPSPRAAAWSSASVGERWRYIRSNRRVP